MAKHELYFPEGKKTDIDAIELNLQKKKKKELDKYFSSTDRPSYFSKGLIIMALFRIS